MLLISFVGSDIVPGGVVLEPTSRLVASVRYLVPLFFVGVALLPIWSARSMRFRTWAGGGVAAFAIWSSFAIVNATEAHAFQPAITSRLPAVISTLEDRGLTRGYASYWDASSPTWVSDDRLMILPVAEDAQCGSPSTAGAVCQWSFNSESSWFIPKPNTTTFILVDPEGIYVPITPSQAIFGRPHDVVSVGDLRVYVYDYDVATRFLSTCGGRSDHGC
jgi:hypothetical protein